MDMGCMVLTFIMLSQMILVLTLLNPVYDVRKMITCINDKTRNYKKVYYMFVIFYFISVIFLGMYIPLQNIHSMIFSDDLDAYDKLILLSRVEKNYIIAGFSLFLVVVLYGVRALLCYTANLVNMVEKTSETGIVTANSAKLALNEESVVPNLQVKRSISYEAILCTNDLKDRLRYMMKNLNYHQYKNVLANIFETMSNSQRANF